VKKSIPSEWKLLKLEDVSMEIYRYPSYYNIEYKDHGIKEIRGGLIKDNGELERNPSKYRKISIVTSNRFPKTILKEGDFVLSVRGTIGKIAIVRKSEKGSNITANLMRISLDKKRCNPDFYKYILLSRNFQKKLNLASSFTTIKTIQANRLKSLEIPLPPLPEQKKIAEILSTVDLAIEDVDRGIIKIEKIKKTLTFNLFTYGLRNKGTKTLKIGRIPKDWKISSLSEIAKVRYGLGQPPPKKEKGIPMIRATNIKEGKIFLKNLLFIDPRDIPDSRNPYLKENDIIVVRSGAYTGDVAYITQEWEGSVAGYDLIITPSENINPKYLSLFLLSNKIQKRYFGTIKERSAQPHLNSHQLEMTPIVYPTLVEQNKVAEIISATDQKMELLQAKKEKLTSIKKGFMYDLLTGQKRVRLES